MLRVGNADDLQVFTSETTLDLTDTVMLADASIRDRSERCCV